MMSFATRRLREWAGSIRALLKMDRPPGARTNNPLPDSSAVREGLHGGQKTLHEEGELPHSNPTSDSKSVVEDADTELSLAEKMEQAKKLYPGSKDWDKDEERLFEILYLRQDIPMLPSHWNIDFRGIPIPEAIFATSDEYSPIVYAHSTTGSREFSATAAITRLIDLTLSVRTLIESAQSPHRVMGQKAVRRKASELIKESLDKYIDWASRDGGYDKLRTVPNIVTEIVDAPETQEDIVQFMMDRMRSLVQLQREFYRLDRDAGFWSRVEPGLMGQLSRKRSSSKKRRVKSGVKRSLDTTPGTPELSWDELATDSPDTMSTPRQQLTSDAKKRRFTRSPEVAMDELAEFDVPENLGIIDSTDPVAIKPDPDMPVKADPDEEQPEQSPRQPGRPSIKLELTRKPPVVYGLYILGTSVFLLTADSSKADSAYISFHVDVNFSDKHQSVWNALTVAIAVCSARDELMSRLDDFKPATIVCDSDPDA